MYKGLSVIAHLGLAICLAWTGLSLRQSCGLLSLYAWLRLLDITSIDHALLASSLPSLDQEASLAQLMHAATPYVPCHVGKHTYEEVLSVPTPFIAHFRFDDAQGHFVVVLKVSEEGVDFLDAQYGSLERFTRQGFERFWSGYTLEVNADEGDLFTCGIYGVSFFVTTLLALRTWRYLAKYLRPACHITIPALLLTLSQGSALHAEVHSTNAGRWRLLSNDGTNAVCLMLRVCGSDVDWSTVQAGLIDRSGSRCTLLDLKREAAVHGVALQIHKPRLSEIANLRLPAIAHLEAGGEGGGQFIVLAAIARGRCGIVYGGPLTYAELSKEEFIREWSGYILVQAPNGTGVPGWLLGLLGGTLTIGSHYAYSRLRQHSKNNRPTNGRR